MAMMELESFTSSTKSQQQVSTDLNFSSNFSPSSGEELVISNIISISDEYFEEEGKGGGNRTKSSLNLLPERNWGLPSFKDQIDRRITYYDLKVLPHEIRLNLEFRKHSTGSDLWDSALVLANFLPLLNLAGKRVVELGSGVGAVGLMCKKFGASITLSDLPENCDLICRNALENGFNVFNMGKPKGLEKDDISTTSDNNIVHVCPIRWGTTSEHLPNHLIQQGGVDLILGSDLFLPYATDLLQPLCVTIAALLQISHPKAEAIIVYEERFDCSAFWVICEQQRLTVECIPSEGLPFSDPGRIFILRIKLTTRL
jgi:predicted nicotinamide N-methyase